MPLSIENADQTVELEGDHQEGWKEFLEGVDSGYQTPSEAGDVPRISFQHAIALVVDYSMAVVVDRNIVEEREKVEYGLERVRR